MHRNAVRCRVGLQQGFPVGLFARWTVCLLTYPLKPSYACEPGRCVQFDFRSGPEFNLKQWCWAQRKGLKLSSPNGAP